MQHVHTQTMSECSISSLLPTLYPSQLGVAMLVCLSSTLYFVHSLFNIECGLTLLHKHTVICHFPDLSRNNLCGGQPSMISAWVITSRPVARTDFGEVWYPPKWTFWTQKVDFLNLTPPLTFLQKPNFWLILWLKVDLLADLGVHRTPLATGLITSMIQLMHTLYCCESLVLKTHASFHTNSLSLHLR